MALAANKGNPDIIDYYIKADYDQTHKQLYIDLKLKINNYQDKKIDLMLNHFSKIISITLQEGKSKIPLDYHFFQHRFLTACIA